MKRLGKLTSFLAIATTSILLVSCTHVPSTQSVGKTKMEDLGYQVITMTADEIDDAFDGIFDLGAKTAIRCTKQVEEQVLFAIWFETKENAQDFKVLFKMTKEFSISTEDDVEFKYEVKGDVFYFGTLQACEDFLH